MVAPAFCSNNTFYSHTAEVAIVSMSLQRLNLLCSIKLLCLHHGTDLTFTGRPHRQLQLWRFCRPQTNSAPLRDYSQASLPFMAVCDTLFEPKLLEHNSSWFVAVFRSTNVILTASLPTGSTLIRTTAPLGLVLYLMAPWREHALRLRHSQQKLYLLSAPSRRSCFDPPLPASFMSKIENVMDTIQ